MRPAWLLVPLAAVLSAGLWAAAVARPERPAGAAPETEWLFPVEGPSWGEVQVPAPRDLTDPALQALGRQLFALRCAACHGQTGRGDGPLAPDLPRRPRDLVGEPLRTRSAMGAPGPGELFRTITAGAPHFGMPALDRLPEVERWALVAHVLAVRAPGQVEAGDTVPLALPPRPATLDPALGEATWLQRCAVCHSGDGTGGAGAGLLDLRGHPCPPGDLSLGPQAFRGGAREEDVARTILLGRPGTSMLPLTGVSPQALWSTAAHVASLARSGAAARRRAWDEFFHARRALASSAGATRGEPEERWDPERSAGLAVAPGGKAGCTACHAGISPIASGAMAVALEACAGGDPDRACALCHEGRPAEAAKEPAHAGLVPNPGSLWVTSLGLGCAKCHSERGALSSLVGLPLPERVGGSLLTVRSRRNDPSGGSGANHAYRMQRALMAQETGKVWLATASVGLTGRDAPRFTALPVDDPDGAEPCAGSPGYRAYVSRALGTGELLRLERGEGLPDFAGARAALGGDVAAAAYLDTYRKECARCHLWGEGKSAAGERRSSGCSACHLLNGVDHLSQEADPTIPDDIPGHATRHELVVAIPEAQCNHCHTRGAETLHSDVHQVAGIGCVDCHTSIDVHGDGNIYAAIPHQLEVRCEDCHGTAGRAPWELPIGHGTRAAGQAARGTLVQDGRAHLLTSRGNARSNWLREGEAVVVVSKLDGRRHTAPLLHQRQPAPVQAVHAADLRGHERLACAACHNQRAPRCVTCHVTWFPGERSQDWTLSALDYDPLTTRQRVLLTPGLVHVEEPPPVRWEPPELRADPDGQVRPRIPGCQVWFRALGPRGEALPFTPRMNPGTPGYPPPVAPSLPHEHSLRARACKDCHPQGVPGGEGPR